MNQNIKLQNENIKQYAQQMENILEDTDNLVFISWKDQKEGIEFIENPVYQKKESNNLTKAEQLEQEIQNIERDLQ